MKRFFSLLALSAMVLSFAHAQVQFKELVWDFGEIQEGEQATHVFTFTNVGKVATQLHNVKASCGCTTPRWTRDPLQPGGQGEIQVTYNSKGRPGAFTKSVTVTVDTAKDAKPIILTIKGNVKKEEAPANPSPQGDASPVQTPTIQYASQQGNLAIEVSEIAAGIISTDKPGKYPFKVKNTGTKAIKLLGVVNSQPIYHFTWEKATLAPGEETTGTLHADTHPTKADASELENKMNFSHVVGFLTDDATVPEKTLTVRGTYRRIYSDTELAKMPRIEFREKEFDGGTVLQGDVVDHTFTFTNTGKSPLKLSSVKASCGCTTPNWTQDEVAPGATGVIKVSFNSAGRSGPQHKTVVVRSNDPENDNLVLHVKCTVKEDPFSSKAPVAPAN